MVMGLAMVIDKMTGFFSMLIENLTVVPELASQMYTLAGGIGALGSAALIGAQGIMASAVALDAMQKILQIGGLDFKDIAAVGDSVVNIGSGVDKFASGLEKISSLTTSLSAITGKGFLAVRSEGATSSMVMGSDEVMKNFIDGKLTVDVKIPEIKLPEITLNVTVNGDQVNVTKMIGRA